MKANLLLLAIVWILVAAPTVRAQKGIEITPFIGGQTNGGLDISTTLFKRIDIQNGLNYGVNAGYLIGKNAGVEFIYRSGTVTTAFGDGIDDTLPGGTLTFNTGEQSKNIVLTVGTKVEVLAVRSQIETLKVGAQIVTLTARPQS